MAIELPVESVPHNYEARHLWDYIIGYTPGDSVDIQLNNNSKEKLRVVAMHGEWEDLLMVGEVGEHLGSELEQCGLDNTFYYYFMVGPVSKFESEDWRDCVVYFDQKTVNLIDRYGIIGPYRRMPNKVYDSAYAEAERLSWEM